MYFFFTGEERYLIDNQLEKWKKAFLTKYGSNNFYSFGEWNFDFEKISSVLMWWGLFDEKKFIIIKGVPKDSFVKVPSWEYEKLENFLLEHLNNLNSENVVCFVSYKPDKRTKLYKFLAKNPNIELKEYKAFTEKQLVAYISKTFKVNDSLAKYIIDKIGTNLFNIHNELEKILKISSVINKDLIDKYTTTNIEQDSFALLDNISHPKKALQILEKLQESKEDIFKIIGLLYWNLKNVILVVEQKQYWLSTKEIAAKLWIHPFVVWKIYKNINDIAIYKEIFKKLIHLDYWIKSWKIDSSLGYLYLKNIILDFN